MFTLDYHVNNTYRYSGNFSNDNFVNFVNECGHKFESIELKDNADSGMSYFGGRYTVEEYFELAQKMYLDTEYIYVRFPEEDVSMFARDYDGTIDVSTPNPNFDLNEFLFEKKSKMTR